MELRSTLGNTLLQILRAVAQQQLQLGTLVVKTLSISVVAVALRTANGPTTQVGEALSIGSAGTVPAVHVFLQMLQPVQEGDHRANFLPIIVVLKVRSGSFRDPFEVRSGSVRAKRSTWSYP